MVDKFSGDMADEVAKLRAEVAELKEIIRARPALTTASQGWRLKDMTIPSVASGEIHVGSNEGELFVRTTSETKRLSQLNLPGVRPQYPSSFTSPATIGSTPTPQNYNDLRADAAMLQVCLRSVIDSGDDIGLWTP